jgi:hypothetical protein
MIKNTLLVIISVLLTLISIESLLRFKKGKHSFLEGSKFNVVLLGDSFLGDNMPIHDMMKSRFKSKSIGHVNLGKSGTGPFEYYKSYLKFENLENTDFLILGYYVGNDLTGTHSGIDIDQTSFLEDLELYKPFQLIQHILSLKSLDKQKWRDAGVKDYLIKKIDEGVTSPLLAEYSISNKEYLVNNLLIEGSSNANSWKKNQALLLRIKELAKERNVKFGIVIFPRSVQINSQLDKFWLDLGFSLDDRFKTTRIPQDLLLTFCEENDIACMDLLPTLKRKKNINHYNDFDDHFNTLGNDLVLDCLSKFIYSKLEENFKCLVD